MGWMELAEIGAVARSAQAVNGNGECASRWMTRSDQLHRYGRCVWLANARGLDGKHWKAGGEAARWPSAAALQHLAMTPPERWFVEITCRESQGRLSYLRWKSRGRVSSSASASWPRGFAAPRTMLTRATLSSHGFSQHPYRVAERSYA